MIASQQDHSDLTPPHHFIEFQRDLNTARFVGVQDAAFRADHEVIFFGGFNPVVIIAVQ